MTAKTATCTVKRVPPDFPLYKGVSFTADRIEAVRKTLPQPGGYKWLDEYIDLLDPVKDWEQVIRTEFNYTFNEFGGSIPHTTAFINVIQNPVGGRTLAGTGKVFGHFHGHDRLMDANGFLFSWMLEGLTTPNGKAEVERLNRLHMRLAKRFPGNFADKDDFIIAIVNLALFPARLREVFGLPPLPENRRIARLHWSRALWANIITELGPARMEDFPKTWEEMVEWERQFNARPHEPIDEGHRAAEALIDHFCWQWFPKPLRFIGREFILMILPDSSIRKHRLGERKPWLDSCIYYGFRLMLLLQSLAPDPRIGLIDRIMVEEQKKAGVLPPRKQRLSMPTVLAFLLLTGFAHFLYQNVR
ncbi:hypothetical protein AnigIFM56816_000577 [Aspergillus niger]|nr:hypothetical protein AnigIFM50267_004666 [Aspergillus niger]GKZ77794.1 hypothetical protein AnigIFM56816_000577 [Aspergillus niger]GLA43441.1 hypothetical protein AnigIFM63309_001367 [Aspergillus niger]